MNSREKRLTLAPPTRDDVHALCDGEPLTTQGDKTMRQHLATLVPHLGHGPVSLAQDIVVGQSVALSGANADIGRDMRDGAWQCSPRSTPATCWVDT